MKRGFSDALQTVGGSGGGIMKDWENTGAKKGGQALQQEVKQKTAGERMKARLIKMLQRW